MIDPAAGKVTMRVVLCLAFLIASATAAAAEPDRAWAGINPGHGALLRDADYARAAARETVSLGLGITRIGIDGVGGASDGAAFEWVSRDRAIDAFLAEGLEVRGVISFRTHVEGGRDQAANWRYFVREVARHYRGKIAYYIIDNEPDLAKVPAETAVAMTCAAQAEIEAVDPTIRIESPPTASAGARYLRQMVELGVTRCADVLGVHSYGAQIDEGHRMGLHKPWQFMKESGQKVIPVADSEGGNSASWAPRGVEDAQEWESRWHRLAWLQHKRYGYDSLILFSLRSPRGLWDVASWVDGAFVPNKPVYAAIQEVHRRHGLENGGFEQPDDPNWMTVYGLDAARPREWSRVDFPAGDARSGARALRMEGPTRVRRVVELLTPGRPLTLSAWARVDGGRASLKALGFDDHDGTAEVVARADRAAGEWRQLRLEVTPRRSWVVVSLEADRGGSVDWDDVELAPAGR